tara:strand:+ start:1867 stop:2277 length:411 start_codon:yes stop_codon:yes gene_type:complete
MSPFEKRSCGEETMTSYAELITVAVVTEDGNVTVEEMPNTLVEYQTRVGGYIEPVSFEWNGQECTAFVDEEGLIKGKAMNPLLCMIVGHPFLVGTGLLCGGVDNEGHNLGLPKTFANALRGFTQKSEQNTEEATSL